MRKQLKKLKLLRIHTFLINKVSFYYNVLVINFFIKVFVFLVTKTYKLLSYNIVERSKLPDTVKNRQLS